MTTLKELVNKILLNNPETRDSDKKLIWEIWKENGLADYDPDFADNLITEHEFMDAPSPESIRRCRQALQRTDLLSGAKLIQPSVEIKKQRVKLSREKGFSYIQGKQPVFNPLTQSYEI